MLLVFLVFAQRENRIEEALVDEYGSALATMAANGAIDAMFNHDLVSLQVILEDVLRNPRVVLATIHDVENNLLVQAGESTPQVLESDSLKFTAPVPLHDSVAGYVSIAIDTRFEADGLTYGVLCVCAVLFFIVVLSIQDCRDAVFEWSNNRDHELDDEPEIAETLGEDPYLEEAAPAATSQLYVTIANLDVLARQISGDLLAHTLALFDKRVERVVALYSGAHLSVLEGREGNVRSHRIVIQIPSYDSRADAAIKAMCAAHLLTSCNHSQSFDLGVRAYVDVSDNDIDAIDLRYLYTEKVANGIYFSKALVSEGCVEGAEFKEYSIKSDDDETHSLCQVTRFTSPYFEWLENQRRLLNI